MKFGNVIAHWDSLHEYQNLIQIAIHSVDPSVGERSNVGYPSLFVNQEGRNRLIRALKKYIKNETRRMRKTSN